MSTKTLALALCRVSTAEQLENNSLSRQREVVLKAAEELGVTIPDDGWWSGSVSSKRGTNVYRKDLNEVIQRCKKDKNVKYVIVDEPDRFMRSINEAAFFEVTFEMLGVKVWYASDSELNKEDLASKLLKFTKYLSAEGSNEERQRKSIAGQTKALKDGRYTFSPKPGYKRGYERGIQELHDVRGPILKSILVRIATHSVTPSQGLVELNKSAFVKDHSLYKMDKFRKIVTDPFYAGIVEIDKQVRVRNENGLHEPLVTKDQHAELLRIMDNRPKNQSGPRKNGNPKYAANNISMCDLCTDQSNGRFVGFDHTNGVNKVRIYERYRCRGCGRCLSREELHMGIRNQFEENPITDEGVDSLAKALDIVWKKREADSAKETIRIGKRIEQLQQILDNQVEAFTDPANAAIKEEILQAINKKKDEIGTLEHSLTTLRRKSEDDRLKFLRFAFGFADRIGQEFLNPALPQEYRLQCKQIMFPAGFYVNKNKKVYTPEKSPLIRLVATKKDAEASLDSHLVQHR